jgi:beta-N-acetylhexosaminidase
LSLSADLDRLAAACLFPSFPGAEAPGWILRWCERGLGGVVLFADNVRDAGGTAVLTRALRAAQPDLIVAIDEEGGDVTRLEVETGSSYPGNLALGVVDDVELTRDVAASIAQDLARVGVTMNLAPVADANTNPDNPVIGVRAFGADPALVARHVAAFVEGSQDAGVAACAKHFPGHGDTAVDSHLELPTVDAEREELDATALVPFRAAIAAGVQAVMTAHLTVPALDAAPATLSERVVTGLLRDELGFGGLVVSDALDMRAIAGRLGLEEAAVSALAAGVDALCLGPSFDADAIERAHAAILAAVRKGRLTGERISAAAEAVARTGAWASSAAPASEPEPGVGAAAAARATRSHGEVALDGAPLVVELVPEPLVAAGTSGRGLGAAVRRRRPDAEVVLLSDAPRDVAALVPPDRRPVLVLRDARRHAWQQVVANELVALRPETVVVETGLPGWLPDGTTVWIETHGAGRVNLEAAAALLSARP